MRQISSMPFLVTSVVNIGSRISSRAQSNPGSTNHSTKPRSGASKDDRGFKSVAPVGPRLTLHIPISKLSDVMNEILLTIQNESPRPFSANTEPCCGQTLCWVNPRLPNFVRSSLFRARANDCDLCRFLGIAAERHASMRRLRRNIIEPWTAYAAGITFCARTESTDIASELASGIPSIHRAADFSLWHWTAPWVRVRV